jgi:GTP-binding protein
MRKGEMLVWKLKERMIVKFNIPSRGIIGLQSITATAGEAIMAHVLLI